MSFLFYLRYALRALRRGGQRTALALLCVAFGAMSLVAMQLLAESIQSAVAGDPRLALGGDAALALPDGGTFTDAQVAALEQLRASGAISRYTLGAQQPQTMLKPPGSGQVYFLTAPPEGVDPATYPLVGAVTMREPAGADFGAAITPPLSAVVTRDLAERLDLKIGDHFTLLGSPDGAAAALTLAGVAQDVPDRGGDRVFFSLETARRLSGGTAVINHAAAIWPAQRTPAAALQAAGFRVRLATDVSAGANGNTGLVFDLMLKGAGILGLIVGGIGVANTLQVMLARRTLEIAMLKTLGYQRRDLLALFGVETGLLGLAGGALGAAAGVALAAALVAALGRTGSFLLPWAPNPLLIAGGVAAAALTALIFGLFTIVRASSVRPAMLLRNLPARQGWRTRLGGAGLLALLLVLFLAVSSLIMGSPLEGAEIIGVALAALLALTILLGGALFALLRLPAPRRPLLTLARQNLKRRPLRAVFPLIALFMGVFTIGFATGTMVNAFARVSNSAGPAARYNLTIYAADADRATVTRGLAAAGVDEVHVSLRAPVRARTAAGVPLPALRYVDGRPAGDAGWDVRVTSGAWSGADGDALAPESLAQGPAALRVGDTVQAQGAGAAPVALRLTGFYAPQRSGGFADRLGQGGGLIVTDSTARRTGGAPAATVTAAVAPARLDSVAAALGAAAPQTTVVSENDVNAALGRRFADLLTFVDGVAALALLAGALLIANAVGLALVERRRELGVLKAVGFTAGRVLAMLALENALLGLLAGVAGMGAVAIAMAGINYLRPAALLSLDPRLAAIMVGVSVALTLLVTALVAWQPARVRPLTVLREE
jgi:putative ABC transport system permease protein